MMQILPSWFKQVLSGLAILMLIAGLFLWQRHDLTEARKTVATLKTDKANLQGQVDGYKAAQAQEIKIHVYQDKLNIQLKAAQNALKSDDPKCTDPRPFLDHVYAGLVGLSDDQTGANSNSAKPSGNVPH